MTSVPKNSLRFTRSTLTNGYLVFDGGRCVGRVTRTGSGWRAEASSASARNGWASFTVVPAPFTRDGLWSTRSIAAHALVAVAADAPAPAPVAADPFVGLPR